MTTTIFLGARASAAEGAPMQGAVFERYLPSLMDPDAVRLAQTQWYPKRALPTFFRDMFAIDIHRTDPSTIEFPTFEEALGVLELAIARGERFLRRFSCLMATPLTPPRE